VRRDLFGSASAGRDCAPAEPGRHAWPAPRLHGLAARGAEACLPPLVRSPWPLLANADAELLGIDSSQRVLGSFFVTFKAAPDLKAIPHSGAGAPLVLPAVRPLSAESTQLLAEALCKHMHATLAQALYVSGAGGTSASFNVS
jgi:hypothetical protein